MQQPLASLLASSECARYGPARVGVPLAQGERAVARAGAEPSGKGVRTTNWHAVRQSVLDRVCTDADQLSGDTLLCEWHCRQWGPHVRYEWTLYT